MEFQFSCKHCVRFGGRGVPIFCEGSARARLWVDHVRKASMITCEGDQVKVTDDLHTRKFIGLITCIDFNDASLLGFRVFEESLYARL